MPIGLLAVLAVAAVVVLDDDDGLMGDAIETGRALSSATVKEGVTNAYTMAIRTGVVAIATMEHFGVHAPITLHSVEPISAAPGLDLLLVRANYVVRRGVHGFRGFPGAYCTDRWPPARLLDLHAPEGLLLQARDQVALTVFVRAKAGGDHSVKGVRVRYRENGTLKEQTTQSTTLTVLARDDEADLEPTAKCHPEVPDHWLDEPGDPVEHHQHNDSHDHSH